MNNECTLIYNLYRSNKKKKNLLGSKHGEHRFPAATLGPEAGKPGP
jgi:hypothetical protein